MAQIFILFLFLIKYCLATENKTDLSIKQIYLVSRMPIAIGYRNFTQFAHVCQMFVDKSLIIKELIEDTNKLISITGPRRWGKTVNMNMMKTFLYVNVDSQGNQILPLDTNINYRIFALGEIILVRKNDSEIKMKFENTTTHLEKLMLISGHKHIMDKYLAKTPVIHLDLYFVSSAKSYDDMMTAFMDTLRLAFLEHEYMSNVFNATLNNNNIDEDAKNEAHRGLKLFYCMLHERDQLNDHDRIESLSFLSKALYRHFNTKVFILLDDYDIPWSTMLSTTWSSQSDSKAFFDFYSNFIKATFSADCYIEKVIMTGKIPPPTELHTSIFQQVAEYNLLNGKLMEYFGITPPLARRMLHEAYIPDKWTKPATRWYNGYKINHLETKFFNTWSLVNFIVQTRRRPRFYFHWIHCENVATFIHNCLKLASFRNPLRSVVYRQIISIKCIPHFTWNQLQRLHQAWQITNYTINDHQFADQALMWLYTTGYLTLGANVDTSTSTLVPVKLPNLEIERTLMLHFKHYYEEQLGIKGGNHFAIQIMLRSTFDKFARNNDQNGTKIAEVLSTYVNLVPLFNDSAIHEENLNKILTYLIIDLSCIRKKEIISTQNLPSTDALLVFNNRTVIVSMQYSKQGAQLICNQATKHFKIVREMNYPIKDLKIIGINIFPNNSVNVCGKLFDWPQ